MPPLKRNSVEESLAVGPFETDQASRLPGRRQTIFRRDVFHLLILFLFLLSEEISGPLRYVLIVLGLDVLVYVPKVLVAGALAFELARLLTVGETSRLLFVSLLVLISGVLIGLLNIGNYLQVGFGAFVMLPFLYGMLVEPAVVRNPAKVGWMLFGLWSVVALGVCISLYVQTPWWGLSYEVGGVTVTASKRWMALGLNRVAGFGRASYAAAYQLLLTSLPIVIFKRRRLAAVALWLMNGLLIAATTTKTAIAIYVLLSALLPILLFSRTPAIVKRMLGRSLPITLGIVAVWLPVSSILVGYRLSVYENTVLGSFATRLTTTWPKAFSLVVHHGNLLLGRGVGGIGTAQKYFEPGLYSYADNMFVYGYATIGVAFIVIFFAFVWKMAMLQVARDRWTLAVWLVGMVVIVAGWSAGGFESAFVSTSMGIVLAAMFGNTSKREFAT